MSKHYLKSGISSIIAALVLILVTIAGSLIVYLWVSGYASSEITSETIGQASMLKVVAIEGYRGHVVVHVHNLGETRAVIDRIYVEKPSGETVGQGFPISPNTVKPGETAAIVFNVGVLPDGKYRIRVCEHLGATFTSPITYLKLSTGIPALVFSEAKLNGTNYNAIELYNPTSAPINITYFTIVIENPNRKETIKIKVLNTTTVYYEVNGASSFKTMDYIAPETVIIPPKGYVVFRGNYGSSVYIFDPVNFTIRVLDYQGAIVDNCNVRILNPRVDLHAQSLQRKSILPPDWVFADPTLGKPNVKEGTPLTT